MYTLFVRLAQFLNSQQEFLSSWLFWTVSFFRHPFVMWPFPLMTYGAFLGSALLQTVAFPGRRARFLTRVDTSSPSVRAAIVLGITGPPDWRSNLATFQELLRRGVSPATAGDLPCTVPLASLRTWLGAVWCLGRDVKVLFIPLLLGLFLGGFLAAWGDTEGFFDLHPGGGMLGQILNAIIGPILGGFAFMVPVGNILVASWLWKTEFLTYAGVVGFFLATVVHPDAVGAYRRLFGAALTLRIVLILLGSAVLASLAVTVMWHVLSSLASLLGVRTFIEQTILTSSITPSTVPWFHELFKPIIAAYMRDVMGAMQGGMESGR